MTARELTRATHELADSLLEIELDATRELLDKSTLSGVTAERWHAASAALQDAWAAHAELEAMIERSGARRAKTVPEPAALLTPARDACVRASACLADVAHAWETFVPRLQRASAALTGTERDELGRLTALLAADPLGAPVADLEALEATVAFRVDARERLAEARAVLAELRAVADESAAAHAEARKKIAGVEVPAPLPLPTDIERRLEEITTPAALEDWSARAAALLRDGRRTLAANRAPIQERRELRQLLDAYHAKARALRALEDPAVSERFERAHRALHTAPTDLQEAARLVHEYRKGLMASEVRR